MDIEDIIELVNQYQKLDQRVKRITSALNSYNANILNYDLLITFESNSRNYDNIYFRDIISEEDMIALITKKREILEAELEEIKRKLEGKDVNLGTCTESTKNNEDTEEL